MLKAKAWCECVFLPFGHKKLSQTETLHPNKVFKPDVRTKGAVITQETVSGRTGDGRARDARSVCAST